MSQRPVIRIVDLPREREQEVRDLEDLVWFTDPTGVTNELKVGILDWRRVRGAQVQGRKGLAGQYATWHFDLGVPGGQVVPVDGLTWVSVHPDMRRRGVLSAMMRHHLREARERGYALGALHASEPGIYARFGYAAASYGASLTLENGAALRAPAATAASADALTTRLVPSVDGCAQALMGVRRRAAERAHGLVVPTPEQQASRYADRPHLRKGSEPTRVLLAERDGEPVGFSTFSRAAAWENGLAASTAEVRELVTVDDAALLALVRRLTQLDLVRTTRLRVAADSPVIAWAGGPRALAPRQGDDLWLRVIDVERALGGRRYSAAADVVLEVVDAVLPEAGGLFRLSCDDAGVAAVTRAEGAGDPDVTVPIGLLGAALLGGTTVAALARTIDGVVEHTAGTITALSRAFATDTAPQAAYDF